MQAPKMQDNRFGRQFGLALLVLGLISFWQEWPVNLAYAFFGFGTLILILAQFAPKLLAPLNKVWMGFGFLLGKVVSPIVLSLIFTVLFVPIALFMRLRGRDELKLRDRTGSSFWLIREESKIAPSSFKNQF
jgi:hypothetical protein